jgi:zinc transport system ATP-binding protein
MNPIIEFDNISFAYQESLVLEKVSCKIFPNEFIGIIGPNGGGKTTLLKLIMGFLKPNQGSIFLFGQPPTIAKQSLLAYVPQSMLFDRKFPINVEEVVLSGLLGKLPWYGFFKEPEKQAAREALKKVGLQDLIHCSFGNLSMGQAQRVLIARALVSKPKLLLLDEPTASVDSQAEAEIYSILKELKSNMTILMVTHDLRAAINHVDRVICVQKSVLSLQLQEVCEHFAVGLYHKPLLPG